MKHPKRMVEYSLSLSALYRPAKNTPEDLRAAAAAAREAARAAAGVTVDTVAGRTRAVSASRQSHELQQCIWVVCSCIAQSITHPFVTRVSHHTDTPINTCSVFSRLTRHQKVCTSAALH